MLAIAVRVLVAGAVLVGGTQAFRGAQTVLNDPRVLTIAAEFKAATGDTDGALRLMRKAHPIQPAAEVKQASMSPTKPASACVLKRS